MERVAGDAKLARSVEVDGRPRELLELIVVLEEISKSFDGLPMFSGTRR